MAEYGLKPCPFCGGKALAFSAEVAKQERTIDDLRQQLSFMQQAMQDAGV